MSGNHIGETRPTARKVTVEFPVSVTIEWPEGIEYSDELAIDVAQSAVSSSYDRNVGPSGKIVWAKCYAEVNGDNAEVVEGGEDEY